jgi:hypothetical protein
MVGRGEHILAKKKLESAVLNSDTYNMYYQRLRDYALNIFEWTGLPESINVRFLETTMMDEGRCVFFQDPSLGFLALPVQYGGKVNVYNEPTEYKAVSIHYNRDLTPENAVLMYGMYSRQTLNQIVKLFARRLYQVERTMDVNIQAQKTPVLILADETQRLTLQNMYMQYDGNEPFIFGNKNGFDKESITVLQTEAPFVSDKLQAYKHNLWNEAMTFLGVGNAKQDKKERLVSDEVSANDEQIQGARYIMLNARQDACKAINKMFGLNVSVDFKLNVKDEVEDDDGILQQPSD